MADWRTGEAVNRSLLRELNEWTEEATDAERGLERPMDTYLCECGDARCTFPIRLTRAEYEQVREHGSRFVLAVNHEDPEIDVVIAENDRFATIEAFFGDAARIARASDPRRYASGSDSSYVAGLAR